MKAVVRRIEERKAFGLIKFVPASDEAALFLKLMRRKTFTEYELVWIRQLGFEVEVIEANQK